MNVQKQVDKLMANKKYATKAIKDKTRKALINTLSRIEAIRTFDEDSKFYETGPTEYKYDDSDNIPPKTVDEMHKAEEQYRKQLQSRTKELFGEDELCDSSIAIDTEIDRKFKWGYTSLHFAALSGDEAECKRLLDAGYSKTAKDTSGKMPWQKAAWSGFHDLAELLKP